MSIRQLLMLIPAQQGRPHRRPAHVVQRACADAGDSATGQAYQKRTPRCSRKQSHVFRTKRVSPPWEVTFCVALTSLKRGKSNRCSSSPAALRPSDAASPSSHAYGSPRRPQGPQLSPPHIGSVPVRPPDSLLSPPHVAPCQCGLRTVAPFQRDLPNRGPLDARWTHRHSCAPRLFMLLPRQQSQHHCRSAHVGCARQGSQAAGQPQVATRGYRGSRVDLFVLSFAVESAQPATAGPMRQAAQKHSATAALRADRLASSRALRTSCAFPSSSSSNSYRGSWVSPTVAQLMLVIDSPRSRGSRVSPTVALRCYRGGRTSLIVFSFTAATRSTPRSLSSRRSSSTSTTAARSHMVRHSLDSDGLTACWLVCTRSRVRRGCRVSPTVAQSQYRAAGSDPRGLSSIKVFNNELLVPTAVHGMHGNTADMILTIDPFDALERPAEGLRAF